MPFLSNDGRSGSSGAGGSSKSSQAQQQISLADLKQQVGLTSIGGGGGNSVTLRSQSNPNQSGQSSSASASGGGGGGGNAAINIQKIIQREAAAAAANLNNNFRSSSDAAAAQAAQRKRRLQMQKMMQNGGSGGMATISFASSNSHGRSHGGSSGHNNNSHSGGGGGGSSSSALQNPNDPMFVSNRRARSNNFTLKETFDLLKVWASPEMQWQMKHNFRNFRVWEAISYQMGQMGHDRTAIQCKNRIQNLTSIFYRIKKSKQDYRTFNFPYYKLIGDVLDGKKAGVSLGASFAGSAHIFGIPHPNDPFLNAANMAGGSGSGGGGSGRNSESPDGSHGFAQHLQLVEEYQHLINGQPDSLYGGTNGTNGTSGGAGRPSSNHSNSGHNVLSPEISLSEGDSPIRVDTSTLPVSGKASGGNKGSRNGPSGKHHGDSDLPTSFLKIEHDDSMNVTLEDGGDLDDDEQNYDMGDESMGMGEEDEFQDDLDNTPAASRNKRSFSTSFGAHSAGAGSSALGAMKGFPVKRPRGVSNASSGGFGLSQLSRPRLPAMMNGGGGGGAGVSDDPMVQYLSDMVEIERQWLDMERERADNERSMMMYMMQILQALVCPADQEDEAEAEAGEEGAGDEEQDGQSHSDLLDGTTMDENSDDPDAEPSASASPAALGSSHQHKGGDSDEGAAQLRQMLRDNGQGDGGEDDGMEEDHDEGQLQEEEGDEPQQQQQQGMVKKGSIEITTTTMSGASTRSHGKPPSLPSSITITKTN